jgi:proteasome lid subunit RPN8/RPN11
VITTLILPKQLCAQIAQEAQSAFPHECCGLIEGLLDRLTLSQSKGEATAIHPVRNLASTRDRFEIDPTAHIALLRALRGTERAIIGCYHSHPNGRAEPSAHDLESANEDGFLWLIAALDSANDEPRIAAFVSTGAGFAPMRVETR